MGRLNYLDEKSGVELARLDDLKWEEGAVVKELKEEN